MTIFFTRFPIWISTIHDRRDGSDDHVVVTWTWTGTGWCQSSQAVLPSLNAALALRPAEAAWLSPPRWFALGAWGCL